MKLILQSSSPYTTANRREYSGYDERVKPVFWLPHATAVAANIQRYPIGNAEGIYQYNQNANPVIEADCSSSEKEISQSTEAHEILTFRVLEDGERVSALLHWHLKKYRPERVDANIDAKVDETEETSKDGDWTDQNHKWTDASPDLSILIKYLAQRI